MAAARLMGAEERHSVWRMRGHVTREPSKRTDSEIAGCLPTGGEAQRSGLLNVSAAT